MSFDTRAGTRGLPMEGSKLNWWMDRQMARRSVRKVCSLIGFDVAILTTIGHRSGTERKSQVCWFPGGDGSWLIVAAAAIAWAALPIALRRAREEASRSSSLAAKRTLTPGR